MSKNRFLILVIAFLLAVLVGLTILEGTATLAVIQQAEAVPLSERGLAADSARWEAIAKSQMAAQPATEIRVEPNKPRSRRGIDAETARWNAIAEVFSAKPVVGPRYSERGLIADAARWTAIAEQSLANLATQTQQRAVVGGSSQRSQRSIEAEAARWNARAELYLGR